jgi:4'-phosphopantetheinyl transferase
LAKVTTNIDVWAVALDSFALSPVEYEATLTAEEILRAESFCSRLHGNRWIASRYALRTILSKVTHVRSQEVEFKFGANGKPQLVWNKIKDPVHFNLSHSVDVALVAICKDEPIGIDIEMVKRFDEMERVAERVFTPTERAQLAECNTPDYLVDFYRTWTRKEAIIKAIGVGLTANLNSIDTVAIPSGKEATRWQLFDLDVGDDFRGALAFSCDVSARVNMRSFDFAITS